ncbi:CBR1 [Cyberlindnera jadinii]|uniref:NADH-cytochrome b5 reductase n=1 Tax=Cyberlindnera jadinii (strain ATCC 18201 / CBS 1600 / BCRC 20928 / JCM 3617 / NBRC 0987 / NRRL Y-1542) TaxID=983966 RepID=A0A0H5C6X8_CYBJN|nr:CBR1 [Cyberlindnera jadinii]
MGVPITVLLAIVIVVITVAVRFLSTPKQRKVLRKDEFQYFPLIQKTMLSHNSGIYRYALPRPDDVLGLPIGQHIQVAARINGKEIVRSYTPTSNDAVKGYFDLLIKHYPEGNISKHIAEMEIGESLKVKGPKGFFEYTPNMVTHFGMVAGGTGITPMFQIIEAIANNPEDKTEVDLVYGNQTEEDILLRQELDKISKEHPNIRIHYMLDKPPMNWKGDSGYVTQEILNRYMPAATPKTMVLLCGPPPMVSSCKKSVVNLGFEKAKPVSKAGDQVFIF